MVTFLLNLETIKLAQAVFVNIFKWDIWSAFDLHDSRCHAFRAILSSCKNTRSGTYDLQICVTVNSWRRQSSVGLFVPHQKTFIYSKEAFWHYPLGEDGDMVTHGLLKPTRLFIQMSYVTTNTGDAHKRSTKDPRAVKMCKTFLSRISPSCKVNSAALNLSTLPPVKKNKKLLQPLVFQKK